MFLIAEVLFIVLLIAMLLMLYRSERILSRKASPQAKIEEYWDGSERRRYVRFKKTLDAIYTVKKGRHPKNGKTVDVSEGGLKLLLDERLTEGTRLDLKIAIPNLNKMAEVEGEVIWSSESQESDPSGKRLFYSGIKFCAAIRETQGANLIDYIRSLSEYHSSPI